MGEIGGVPSATLVPVTARERAQLAASVGRTLEPLTDHHSWIEGDVRRSTVGLFENNVPLVAVRDARTGAQSLAAYKPVSDFGHLEIVGSHVAAIMGAGDLVGAAYRLPDGAAAIPFVAGRSAGELGIHDANDLVGQLGARSSAVRTVTRMLALDVVIADHDRNEGNVILDQGRVRLIDHAYLDMDLRGDPEAPRVYPQFVASVDRRGHIDSPLPIERVGGRYEVPIPADVAHGIGAVTRERLEPVFARAVEDAAAVEHFDQWVAKAPKMLDGIVSRAAWIAANGRVRFRM